jgi:hypothetical protein
MEEVAAHTCVLNALLLEFKMSERTNSFGFGGNKIRREIEHIN